MVLHGKPLEIRDDRLQQISFPKIGFYCAGSSFQVILGDVSVTTSVMSVMFVILLRQHMVYRFYVAR